MARIKAREGYVLLEDVSVRLRGVKKFHEVRHRQPQLAMIIEFTKPSGEQFIPWDEQISVGMVVLKPVTQKYEFDDGQGRRLLVCHHSDIKVFFDKNDNDEAGPY